ncbi:hypothetical protein [Neptunomonas sp.]|uniref:hypothetical protein n=1 Tax=Neptunomonas sp. TaxID=1971898 RepID=UPI00356ACEE0
MKTSRMLNNIILGLAISFVPITALAKDKLKYGVTYQNQGPLQEVITKGTGSVMIDNIMYKVASHAKITEAGNRVKLRHLDLGVDVQFSYTEDKNSDTSPVITSISVIMK